MTASWWLRSFYIPALLPETLIKVTAEHLAVKKLAAETQTESWPHLCKAFSPDQHCLLARQDLIVPVCSVPSLMYLLKMVELLKWLFIFSCFATEICQMFFFFSLSTSNIWMTTFALRNQNVPILLKEAWLISETFKAQWSNLLSNSSQSY